MYKVIREAISKELAEFCYNYLYTKRKVAKVFFDIGYVKADDPTWGKYNDPQAPNTYSCYSDIVMETLLIKVQPLMEVEIKSKIIPTYSYARLYKNNDILLRHTDRYSCELSTTLNLGGDPWPIFLEPSGEKGTKGISILLEPGDMLIYEGGRLEHWREAFEGKNCGQVFLHYNINNSTEKQMFHGQWVTPKAEQNKYDGRAFLGLPDWLRGRTLNDNDNCS